MEPGISAASKEDAESIPGPSPDAPGRAPGRGSPERTPPVRPTRPPGDLRRAPERRRGLRVLRRPSRIAMRPLLDHTTQQGGKVGILPETPANDLHGSVLLATSKTQMKLALDSLIIRFIYTHGRAPFPSS